MLDFLRVAKGDMKFLAEKDVGAPKAIVFFIALIVLAFLWLSPISIYTTHLLGGYFTYAIVILIFASLLILGVYGILRLFGGRGHLRAFYPKSLYLISSVSVVFFIAESIGGLIYSVALGNSYIYIGWAILLFLIMVLAQTIYTIYLWAKLAKNMMEIGSWKAAAAIIFPALIGMGIVFLLISDWTFCCGPPEKYFMDPNIIATTSVKDLKNQRGSPQFLDNVTFKNGSTLISSTIADKSRGLSTSQVCVLVSPNTPNSSKFVPPTSGAEGKIIRYDGQSSQKARLLVLCDRKSDMGSNDGAFKALGFDSGDFKLNISGCWDGASDSATVCLVAIVPEA